MQATHMRRNLQDQCAHAINNTNLCSNIFIIHRDAGKSKESQTDIRKNVVQPDGRNVFSDMQTKKEKRRSLK